MADHSSNRQETGGGVLQMAEEDIACLMEGSNTKQDNHGKNESTMSWAASSEGKD